MSTARDRFPRLAVMASEGDFPGVQACTEARLVLDVVDELWAEIDQQAAQIDKLLDENATLRSLVAPSPPPVCLAVAGGEAGAATVTPVAVPVLIDPDDAWLRQIAGTS